MRLNIIAEDSRLNSGTQCCFIASVEYDEEIPWDNIHEAERFLRLKIIVCEDCGAEHFMKATASEEAIATNDYSQVPYEDVMSSFKTVDCETKSDFINVLNNGIVEYFGDCLSPDLVDAAFIRGSLQT